MSHLTYDYLNRTIRSDHVETIVGVISSFNITTYKGRIFVFDEQRPIPFELSSEAQNGRILVAITSSLRANAAKQINQSGKLRFHARRLISSTGRLKAVIVFDVEPI